MKQVAIAFDLPEDPVSKAAQDALWWLVTRIRTRAEAEEALRIAAACLTAATAGARTTGGAGRTNVSGALAAVRQAVATWDEAGDCDADRLSLWDRLEAQLARTAATRELRPDRAACLHHGRLMLAALREAYAIQKQGNQAVARWAKPQGGAEEP